MELLQLKLAVLMVFGVLGITAIICLTIVAIKNDWF